MISTNQLPGTYFSLASILEFNTMGVVNFSIHVPTRENFVSWGDTVGDVSKRVRIKVPGLKQKVTKPGRNEGKDEDDGSSNDDDGSSMNSNAEKAPRDYPTPGTIKELEALC
jgi:hypothetical protein